MKKLLFSTTLFLLIVGAFAQMDATILPKSAVLSRSYFSKLKTTELPPLNRNEAQRLDSIDAKTGDLPKFSRSLYTHLDLTNSGAWVELPDGSRVWRLALHSPGALALIPFYNKFYLPTGATLHLYSPDRKELLGAFTSVNNPETGYYCTGIINGDACILEYYEPKEAWGKGVISINEVGYAYRSLDPERRATQMFGTSGSCQVNVNCSEGAAWQDQKNSVVRILVQSTQGQGFCSGALINNARQDCTPYLLSAQHCSEGTTTNQYSQWVFYFNYESPTCANPASEGSLASHVVIGCNKIADSNDNGGDSGSDFLLLRLNNTPNANFNAYYSGWNADATAPASGVAIHHPDADIKKISTYTSAPASASWGGLIAGTHWSVRWAATANGHGVTEGGSSGSPLFNQQGQIVGQLTGGDSYCQTPNAADVFGKFSYSWTSNGSTAARQLKAWLDPDNSGITSLGGVYAPCAPLLPNDAGILSITSPAGTLCASSFVPTVILKNYGANNLTSVTISYTLDGVTNQYNWSGNLGSSASATLTLPALNTGEGSHLFSAETINPNHTADGNNSNNSASTTFAVSPPTGQLTLFLQTDIYGTETGWEITNTLQQVVASGGPYSDGYNNRTHYIPLCLAPGCYRLSLFDSYGDGMSGTGSGAMTLSSNYDSTVYAQLTNTNFGDEITFDFCIPQSTDIHEELPFVMAVVPNPSNGTFLLRFETNTDKDIVVFNALGGIVYTSKTEEKDVALHLSQQSKGVYFVSVKTHSGTVVKKIFIQ